ncbi:hypothetical protein COCVIDRAFT_21847 [Bipolaris victoriae FI3]|uniref:AMP-dependent synthetase/ligase domain-containing protein n=1 Tax=Bipolaris victoriae (strain FI3) TaxID=930091 RepID=W7F0V4_BIPV3|nr:hypothetical protein COCVIDRAFT_21847 [Bipolaris victoriae FI3]
MPIKPRFTIPVPQVSLPTFIFDSPSDPLPKTPILISAANPESHFLSLHGHRQYAKRFASGLLRAGLQLGDRVLLFSSNTLFFPAVLMGTIMAEGIFTGANPTYVVRELAYQLQDSGARFLICAEGSLDTGIAAAKEVGLSADRIFVFDDGAATFEGRKVERDSELGRIRHWTELLDTPERGEAYTWPELRTAEELDRVVALNYSSGTTGMAKGVMITHRNYVSNCVAQLQVPQQQEGWEELRPRKRFLIFLPMYHAMAQSWFGMCALKLRVPVYMMAKFDLLQMLEYVQKYRITDLVLVPPIIVLMAKHPETKKFDLSSVEEVNSGAAPLGGQIKQEFERLWPPGKISVRNGWGMTELTTIGCNHYPSIQYPSSSVGELYPNIEAKLVLDDQGKVEASQGEQGELWVRGPNIMKGYWKKPDATKETITPDGWLKTGDAAYVDANQHFHIVDRKKELIKVKGLQVAPAELEALLLDHPQVQDAAVIGVQAEGTELPRAYIVLRSLADATPEMAENIKAWLAERVAKYKRLEGGVHFVDAIPKNPSGKILRKELRNRAAPEDPKPKL